MARAPDRDDPLATVRQLLRDVRNAARLAVSPAVQLLCPDVPPAQRQAALVDIISMALYRLPARQREVLRRYDLEGQSAAAVQRAMALSPRQFFRDRHAGLVLLSAQLLSPSTPRREPKGRRATRRIAATAATAPRTVTVGDPEIVRRAFARGLREAGDPACLRVLRDLAHAESDAQRRTDLFLDLADAAVDCDDDGTVAEAANAIVALLREAEPSTADRSAYVEGRLARVLGRSAPTLEGSGAHYEHALQLLRRSAAAMGNNIDAQAALAESLGDLAVLNFAHGAFAQARSASAQARTIVEAFGLSSRPKGVEMLAMDATLDACISGRTERAIALVASLLVRAVEAGWCSTACKLGGTIVGLHCLHGDYEDAIAWYRRMAPYPLDGLRPRARTALGLEAAHAFTMTGRAAEALSILAYERPEDGSWQGEAPCWHGFAAGALERLDEPAAALSEALAALAGYEAQHVARGRGDAHRIIATCQAKLGNMRAAREHILESQRIVESYGTPYSLLRTLVAKANLFDEPAQRVEAIEFAQFLRRMRKEGATA